MAMTDYVSKLVHTGYANGNSARPIQVYVAYKSSQSIDTNRSTILVGMYVTTIAGYPIGAWEDFNGSYVGTTSLTFNGSIPNFSGTRWLVENKSFTVDHNDDGSGTATIYWKWGVNSPWGRVQNPSGSFTINLPTIARASSVSTTDGTLGTEQTLTVARKASGFTHTITYKCGGASGTVVSKSGSTSVKWTPPLSLAAQNTAGRSVSITLTITTFNGDKQVGSAKSTTFNATIPDSVKPTASLTLSDPTGHKATYGGYIQGQSQLTAELTGTGIQGSTIKSYQIKIGNDTYSGSSRTVDLPKAGSLAVTGTVTDSRTRTGSDSETITVLEYTGPKVSRLAVARCTADGTLKGDGTYAKATFSASVTPLNSKNSAAYALEYREAGGSNWSHIDVADASGDYTPSDVAVVFAAAADAAFEVRVVVTDDFGTVPSSLRTVPVAFALLQGDTTGTGLAVGQMAVDPNTFAVGIPMKVAQELYHGGFNYFESDWIDLGLSDAVGIPSSEFGNYLGCAYRIIGRHVFVAFACSFTYAGSAIVVNSTAIPEAHRPPRNQYAMCATGGRAIARVLVNAKGQIAVDWIQILSSAEATQASTVSWLSGYLDYWI